MLDQVMELFNMQATYDLNIMTPDQTLAELTARALTALDRVMGDVRPDFVFVQGDTTTTFMGALAAFYHHIPVGHVEAGLRTHDRYHPYPEELNRVLTSSLADLHFAPTAWSRENLRRENIPEDRIHVTGNTVIDALLEIADREYCFTDALQAVFAERGVRRILLTTHRRESHGRPMEATCRAVLRLLDRCDDVEVVCPVHLSPKVRKTVLAMLGAHPRIHLIAPLDYQAFINAMKSAYLILTDSGGVQEEAPALGKPVLVLRETTERPEAVEAGTVKLVGTDEARIFAEASRLLDDPQAYRAMARAVNPYGDGYAAQRILRIVDHFLCR
jgi:UDP-N-acetylglucosamine 2-epimerase (non-hydrolysing)